MAARPGVGQLMIRARASELAGAICRVVRFDPKNPQIVYLGQHCLLEIVRTAGKPGTVGVARPAGDDYQNIWINPNNTDIILLGSDQGAIVTSERWQELEFLV